MASNINITLKRNNGTDYDVLYPKTIPAQVVGLLTDGKISVSLLPNSVFDSLYFVTSLTTATQYDPQSGNALLRDMVHYAHTNVGSRSIIGAYFVATETTGLDANSTGALSGYGGGLYWITRFTSTDEGGLGTAGSMGSATTTTLETGDWIVITNRTGAGTVGDPYIVTCAVVENTYELATTGVDGIVRLSSSTSVATTGDKVVTDGILAGLMGTTGTKIAYGNHTHSGVYEPANAGLTDLAALLTTGTQGFIRVNGVNDASLDTNTYLTSQSSDFGNIAVTTTDSGHTWGATGTATADTTADSLTIVDGAGVDVEVSPTTDAIRIQHTDTSTLNGAQGSAGIASITVDGFGHVTAVTTATYNNYSLPLAANGTRGGLQIGYTSTETQRALELSSEKGFVTLPRQIPAVTLNGSASTSPSFYAPTGSGLAGSTTQVKQMLVSGGSGVAPSWIDTPHIYYDTTTGSNLGDIIFDVD
jgi:hypothetical protein